MSGRCRENRGWGAERRQHRFRWCRPRALRRPCDRCQAASPGRVSVAGVLSTSGGPAPSQTRSFALRSCCAQHDDLVAAYLKRVEAAFAESWEETHADSTPLFPDMNLAADRREAAWTALETVVTEEVAELRNSPDSTPIALPL